MPGLPRVQLFEFNDRAWAPAVLRDTIVESLSRTLRWGRVLDGLVDPLIAFLDAAGTHRVLDLGSGAGGPAEALAEAAARRGRSLELLLTDLFPRPAVWSALRARHPGVVDFVPGPVDATEIPRDLSRGRARVIINTFHHFPEPLGRAVLADAIRARAPLFLAEGFERNPLRFAPFAPAGLAALCASPLLAHDRRLARAALVYGTPLALMASIWDGVVSTLRVYTEEELRAMVSGAEGYRWSYGTYDFVPWGRGYYFHGLPSPA
jgi:SAM-dependent methyltransferase